MRSATTSPTAYGHHSAPSSAPTSSTLVAVTTCAPSTSVISASLVIIALPPIVRMPVTLQLPDELVTGDDRTRVREALLGVDRARQHDAGVGLGEQLLQRVVLDDHREGRRRDDVGESGGAGRLDVGVLRGVGEDGARELAHLLASDEVRGRRRELPADQFLVHCHPSILPRAARRPRSGQPFLRPLDRLERHLHGDDDEVCREQHVADGAGR